MKSALIVLIALLAVPCFADTLPDKPRPQPAAHVSTVETKLYWAEVGTMAAAWTADTITTHQAFSANPATHEGGPFFPGTRSTAKVMGAWAAIDVGAAVAAYEWKQHVHNRYLHPLWHVFMAERIYGHVGGTEINERVLRATTR